MKAAGGLTWLLIVILVTICAHTCQDILDRLAFRRRAAPKREGLAGVPPSGHSASFSYSSHTNEMKMLLVNARRDPEYPEAA